MSQKISQFVVLVGLLFMSFQAFSGLDSQGEEHLADVKQEELQASCALIEEVLEEDLSAQDLLVYFALQGKSISALDAVTFIKVLRSLDNVKLIELVCMGLVNNNLEPFASFKALKALKTLN